MSNRRGFTLVEMSIVLVIIGLLIGGILVAQSMIETAKIGAQIKQLSQFDSATNAFIVKYGTFPGDANLPTPPTAYSLFNDNSTKNDGIISGNGGCFGSDYYTNECAYVFEHLSVSGLRGNYTAAVTSGFPQYNSCGEGKAFPSAILENTEKGSSCVYASQNSAGELYWMILRNQRMDLTSSGSPYPAGHDHPVTPIQAQALDSKIDDGNAFTGNVAMADSWNSRSVCPGCIANPQYPLAFWYGTDPAYGSFDGNCLSNLATGQYNTSGTHVGYATLNCNLQIKANVY